MNSILFVEGKLSSGKYTYAGKEKMIQWLGNQLANDSFDVTFCTIYDKTKPLKTNERIKSISLNLPYYKSFFRRNITLFLQFPLLLKRILQKHHYNYIVSFGDTSYFILALLKRRFNYKLIVSERSDPYYNRGIQDKLKRKYFQFADTVVFQTKGAQSFFSETIQKKGIIIPNPIKIPSAQWKIDNTTISLANVGRIDLWQKRQDLLVESFALVCGKYPEAILNIYGSGEDKDRLINIIHRLRLENNIFLHGAIKEINSALLTNRIFVLSSDFEGIPNALLEAMALGMPVISTNCSPGGAALLIQNNYNGVLVPQNDVTKLATAICELIEKPDLCSIYGKNARISMSKFSEDIIYNMWKQIFI